MVEQNRNDMTRHEEKETGLFAKVAKKREALWESGIGERRDDDKEKNFVTIERAKKSGIQTIMAIPWQDSFYSPLFLFVAYSKKNCSCSELTMVTIRMAMNFMLNSIFVEKGQGYWVRLSVSGIPTSLSHSEPPAI